MSRFEVVKEIASNQNYELLENHLLNRPLFAGG